MQDAPQILKWREIEDVPYLTRHVGSGTLYCRRRFGRRVIRRSLHTEDVSEAKRRLPEVLAELKAKFGVERDLPRLPVGYAAKDELMATLPTSVNLDASKATKWSEAAGIFLDELSEHPGLSEGTVRHRAFLVRQHMVLWADLKPRRLTELPEDAMREYFTLLAKRYSPGHYNALRWVMRSIINIMRQRDARLGFPLQNDPTAHIRCRGARVRNLELPTKADLDRVLDHLETHNPQAAFAARVTAYTGVRWSEGQLLRWGDVDFVLRRVKVWCFPGRRTAPTVYRYVPLKPEALSFFRRWADALGVLPQDRVVSFQKIDRPLRATTKALDLPNIRCHDLRHYFVLGWIEAGADLPTISRWIGFRDHGVQCLRMYGHLVPDHSQQAAAHVVSDTPKPVP